MGRIDPHLTWYTARASGLVAWVLVTTSIVWGLALSGRFVHRRGMPAWLLDVHRYLGTLSLVFVGVHLLALWADGYVHFAWREMFVPYASQWRPGAVAWGIVATYLLVAIEVTSWAVRHLPRRAWHAVHLSSLVLFVVATLHGFAAGADAKHVLVRWGAASGALFVVLLLVARLLATDGPPSLVRPTPVRR
jgi:ferric reductase like protein